MEDALEAPVRIAIASTPAHLPIVRAALERLCDMLGLDDVESGKVVLAVDEALTNIIRHAYHDQKDKPIEVTFARVPAADGRAALRIELRDWGTPAEPERIKPRDLDDIRPGGLGVHIINSVMEEVRYAPAPDGGTCLTMTKVL